MPARVHLTKRRQTMTTENKKGSQPAYYIFVKEADGTQTRIGAAFKHAKGTGLNIVLDNKRYIAFPPKAKAPQ